MSTTAPVRRRIVLEKRPNAQMMKLRALCFLAPAMLSVAAGAPAANAGELFGSAPSVQVTVPAATTEAQLQSRLEQDGFAAVRLSQLIPTPIDPLPQADASAEVLSSAVVHEGWNGTAEKDGRTYWVRVAFGPIAAIAEH